MRWRHLIELEKRDGARSEFLRVFAGAGHIMSASRWQEVKALFEAASKRTPSECARFLDEVYPNEEVRREVESLLQAEIKNFLEDSPADLAASSSVEKSALIGRQLSHYKVLSVVSRGGMGIVYRALDVKLNREVAIKVLPTELTENEERKRRFVQEAQAAAALEHPHIAVIYEIDDAEGVTFIAMELIRGEQLGDLLAKEKLTVARALEIAIEIAEELARAHEKGIVHRDLNPANIMITYDAHVKIIDFGLAKLMEQPTQADSNVMTAVQGRTASGVVMGTTSYMSPEQARGLKVDHRSDIFSFGIVLYEILTGSTPFKEPSGAETLNAIINTPAPPLDDSVDVAAAPQLQRVLDGCLAKDASDRYPEMKALLSDLRVAKRDSDSGASGVKPWRAPRRTRALLTPRRSWALPLTIGATVAGIGIYAYSLRVPPPPRLSGPVQVTLALGVEDYPTWSPDGRSFAYAASETGVFRGGNWDIMITQVGGGEPLNRTADYDGVDSFPSWSPDGTLIAFHSNRDGGGVFVMSPLSDAPRRVVPPERTEQAEFSSAPKWSRDGTKLAFIDHMVLEIVSVQTGEFRRFELPGSSGTRYDPSWSPDERFMAFVAAQNRTATVTELWLLRLEDGEATPLTDGQFKDWSPSWSIDGRALYYVSNRGGAMDLWQLSIGSDGTPTGEPVPLTVGIGMRRAAWLAPGLLRRRADRQSLARADSERARGHLVRRRAAHLRSVADYHRQRFRGWVIPAEGGEPPQITDSQSADFSAQWSRDGKSLLWISTRDSEVPKIWRVRVEGGLPQPITKGTAWYPTPVLDGERIYFTGHGERTGNIWEVSIAGGEERPVTDFRGKRGSLGSESLTTDGDYIYFSWQEDIGDIWVMDASRP